MAITPLAMYSGILHVLLFKVILTWLYRDEESSVVVSVVVASEHYRHNWSSFEPFVLIP